MAASLKIRRDDEVVVISGKDRGKTGKVLRVDPKKERVYVEGVNIVKRHQRTLPNAPQIEAGVIEREGPGRGWGRRGRQAQPRPPGCRDEVRLRQPRTMEAAATQTARFKTQYLEQIRPALIERVGYSSYMQA